MKKRIAILLGLILVLSAAFAACSQPAATAKAVRIDGNETHTFKISIADFADAGSTPFNVYTKKINQKNEDGTTTETTLTARKDEVIMSGEVNLMNNSDQIRPLDASGTYTVNIDDTTNATTVTVTTEQILYCQYETAKLQELNCLETVKKYNVTSAPTTLFERIKFEDIKGLIAKTEEKQRMEAAPVNGETREQISIDDFAKIEMRVGTVIACEAVKKSKLLHETVSLGNKRISVLSGIAKHYTAEEMVGKRVIVVCTLPPREMKGLLSEGLIVCAEAPDGTLSIVAPEKDVPDGSLLS